ncbi:MAG: copper resistance protein B, partial [Sphingopyxis sp.]|uniref:copper resistance protein B n=1 Tax=Sphingopyxis sp. TaxID=1908224 RepID=UPI00403828F0
LLLAGIVPIAFASPAAAQSMDHSAHGSAPAPVVQPAPKAPEKQSPRDHAGMQGMDMKPDVPDCAPEHAALGHCTPKETPAEAMAGMSGMASAGGASGTDLPPGNNPAPAPPGNWYADRIYPSTEMDRARHEEMRASGGQSVGFISLNLAEYQARKGGDGFRWEGEAWYGGDINRLTLKSWF